MIGSKLLFSGYGDRRYGRRAHHAGMVGRDTLTVHEDAHAPRTRENHRATGRMVFVTLNQENSL